MTLPVRPFQRTDWLGATVVCPHCQQKLKIVEADGPYPGFNPESGQLDQCWIVTLEDGESARMWEDNKGVVVVPKGGMN